MERIPMKKLFSIPALTTVLLCLLSLPQICTAEDKASTPAGSYIIGAGDILEVVTWKEADLTREGILVRTDGMITFPLLDDVMAAGLTPVELKGRLEKGLGEFVEGPHVTVTVSSPGSQKFYILGEVARTGEYPLFKELTVLQAFALAGGFTEWASKSEIILLRREGDKDRMLRIDYKDIVKGRGLEQNIKIRKDDTIIVP